jgi:hypothetical protein
MNGRISLFSARQALEKRIWQMPWGWLQVVTGWLLNPVLPEKYIYGIGVILKNKGLRSVGG